MKKVHRKLIDLIIPPQNWVFAVSFINGVLVGIILLVIYISNAPSYLSDKPEACINCHIMTPYYITWRNSSHFRFTTCNDCHVPQDNFVRKYYFKSNDGLRHATIFTLKLEPQVIQIKESGKNVVQENCIRCHQNLIERTTLLKFSEVKVAHNKEKLCWDCHREVPHGRVNSAASTPYARVPKLTPILPEWLSKFFENR
jgi:cytochrome c nitrite reductase small subunit